MSDSFFCFDRASGVLYRRRVRDRSRGNVRDCSGRDRRSCIVGCGSVRDRNRQATGSCSGATGAVVVVTCASSFCGFAVLVLSGLLSARVGVVSEADCARTKTHSRFRGVCIGLELREFSSLT